MPRRLTLLEVLVVGFCTKLSLSTLDTSHPTSPSRVRTLMASEHNCLVHMLNLARAHWPSAWGS